MKAIFKYTELEYVFYLQMIMILFYF